MKDRLISVTRHPVALLGAALAVASAVMILSLLLMELIGFDGGPYIGILAFLVVPAFFVLGLLLIPLGAQLERRRVARAAARGETVADYPVIDFNQPSTRKRFLWFLGATVINVVILAAAMYKGVEVTESTAFCGRTCHTVMQPEYTAWQAGAHARVACVSCHIGPGADWFVRSKLSGSWQVIAVTFNLYPRPIGTPIENLRPARDTCEQCHWPTKFVGDRLKVITHFDEDEANTEKKTVLVMRVGGAQGSSSQGIHWHVDPKVKIRYQSDAKREAVGVVELTRPDGGVVTYRKSGAEAEPGGEWRTMDCVDCHNRPSHTYRLPEPALDLAIQAGQVDRSLPFVRREGLALLKSTYASHEDARAKIPAVLLAFYEKERPDVAAAKKDAILAAGKAIAEIYAQNVFPTMKVEWGTYPNHIGHPDMAGGCFRCHDGEHATADGKTIDNDCGHCHAVLAQDEADPGILAQLKP